MSAWGAPVTERVSGAVSEVAVSSCCAVIVPVDGRMPKRFCVFVSDRMIECFTVSIRLQVVACVW